MVNSSTSVSATMTFTGTFRLDNGNLYITIQNATYTDTTGANNCTTFEQVKAYVESDGTSTFPYTKGTEFLYGTYAVNGNTLTITQAGSSTSDTFTKQ